MNACDNRLRGKRKHARTARHQLRRSSDRLCTLPQRPNPYSTNKHGIHTVWPAYALVPKEACRIHSHTIRPCFVHPCLTRVPPTPCGAHVHTRPSNHNLFLRVQIIIASLWLLWWWDQNGMSGVKRVLARMCKTIAASPSRRKRTHTCAKLTCGAPFRWLVWVGPQGRRVVFFSFVQSLLVVFCNTDGLESSNRVLQQKKKTSCSRARDMILCTTLGNALVLSYACV
jgi:hypothetical protein